MELKQHTDCWIGQRGCPRNGCRCGESGTGCWLDRSDVLVRCDFRAFGSSAEGDLVHTTGAYSLCDGEMMDDG